MILGDKPLIFEVILSQATRRRHDRGGRVEDVFGVGRR
jgi:hypothetical protein